jgi:hypothetical protein
VEKLHRERVEKPPRPRKRYHGQGEAEVVPAFQFVKFMQGWIDQWYADRPVGVFTPQAYKGAGNTFYGPIAFLAHHTGINERRVRMIVKGNLPFIPLSDADQILQAANLGHLLSTGEIQVVPNPNWSPEKWISYMRERGCA